jgi:hypothetical protein
MAARAQEMDAIEAMQYVKQSLDREFSSRAP